MYVGVPTDPPRGVRRLTARPADPQGLGQPRGGGGSPPPYSPQNCHTPLGVTHWLAAAPVEAGRNKIPGTTVAFVFTGYPRRGGGGVQKYVRKISISIFGSKNLRTFEIYPTPLNLEGTNRILSKVSIDILADMGGICVQGHLASGAPPRLNHAFFQDAALCGCTMPFFRMPLSVAA